MDMKCHSIPLKTNSCNVPQISQMLFRMYERVQNKSPIPEN